MMIDIKEEMVNVPKGMWGLTLLKENKTIAIVPAQPSRECGLVKGQSK